MIRTIILTDKKRWMGKLREGTLAIEKQKTEVLLEQLSTRFISLGLEDGNVFVPTSDITAIVIEEVDDDEEV